MYKLCSLKIVVPISIFFYPFIFVVFFFFFWKLRLKVFVFIESNNINKICDFIFLLICYNVTIQSKSLKVWFNNTFWYKHIHISTRRLKVFIEHIEQQSTTKMIILGLMSISKFMNFNFMLYWTLKQTEVFAMGWVYSSKHFKIGCNQFNNFYFWTKEYCKI